MDSKLNLKSGTCITSFKPMFEVSLTIPMCEIEIVSPLGKRMEAECFKMVWDVNKLKSETIWSEAPESKTQEELGKRDNKQWELPAN